MSVDIRENIGAQGVPFFVPAQLPAAGTALDPQPNGTAIPTLFQPIKIRGLELQNRLWVRLNDQVEIPADDPSSLAVPSLSILSARRKAEPLALRTPYASPFFHLFNGLTKR